MKLVGGVFLVLLGIVLGIYVGLWVMFIGGILQILHAFQATPWLYSDIAWGVFRIVLSSFTGWLSAVVLIIPGIFLIQAK